MGETFDAMVEELVDYRLARHLYTKRSPLEEAFRLKVIQARGRPILMLDRDRSPQLPEGETPFTANGVVYAGNFAKIALNAAHRAGWHDAPHHARLSRTKVLPGSRATCTPAVSGSR